MGEISSKRNGVEKIADIEQKKNNIESLCLNRFFTDNMLTMKIQTTVLSGCGLHINDIIIVDCSLQPFNDQIVVIKIDGQWLIRKYSCSGNRMCFFGDNNKISPLHVDGYLDGLEIIGVVKFIIRSV